VKLDKAFQIAKTKKLIHIRLFKITYTFTSIVLYCDDTQNIVSM
jgi:hypothetical protein